ncbi:MAG: DUF4129 domain-containing protein [Acidobacteriaceae bacterium]
MRRCSWFIFVLVGALMLDASLDARALDKTSLVQYQAHLANLQALVASCGAKAAACDANAVGADEEVQLRGLGVGANVDSFEAHYEWLRDALTQAGKAGDKKRVEAMKAAGARLDEALLYASGDGRAHRDIAAARRRADTILSKPEFATVRGNSLWERFWAHVAQWLDKIFNGVAKFGKRSPWIGPVMEWGLIGLALVGLVVWAMHVLQRQRLAVRVEAGRQMEAWEEASRNWRALAEERAASGAWREAVHCLYWASIAALEGRKLWAPNRSRTPREYVRLLESGSARWRILRQQTQGFERVWYGLRDAARQDYERALALHEELRAA